MIFAMGIILLAMFIPLLWLSVAALVVSKRSRKGKEITKPAYVVLGLQLVATIWPCVSFLTGPEEPLRWVNRDLAIFMLSVTTVCSLILFTPNSKVFKRNR